MAKSKGGASGPLKRIGELERALGIAQERVDHWRVRAERAERALEAKPLDRRVGVGLGPDGGYEITLPGRGEGYGIAVKEAAIAETLSRVLRARASLSLASEAPPGSLASPLPSTIAAWSGPAPKVRRYDLKGRPVLNFDDIEL